jgi:hypothetical protein
MSARRWGRPFPAALSALACALCCTVPVLAATGVVSGGAMAAAVGGWLEVAAVLLFVAAGLLVLGSLWRRPPFWRRVRSARLRSRPAASSPGR